MRIIICGAGQVGWQIARQLSGERHDIVLIDHDHRLIQQANDALDVQGVVGHASHPEVLDSAGAGDADLLIAATASDEVNIVACEVAHALFTVPRRIARIRGRGYLKPEYADLYQADSLSIDVVISPEREVAQAALARLDGFSAVLWWGDAETARDYAQALAGRPGPILPLVTAMPDRAHAVHERHLCVDTTAAGGNAALLAG